MLNNYTYYKLNYPKHILMLKNGNFYISLDNDALIMSNVFNYKVKQSNNVIKAGFPIGSLSKVIMKLKNLNLNYLVIADGIIDVNNCDINVYDEYLSRVIDNKVFIKRIGEIYKVLLNNINKSNIRDVINEIESVLCKID